MTQFARRDPEESCRMRKGLRTHENVKPPIALGSSNAIYKKPWMMQRAWFSKVPLRRAELQVSTKRFESITYAP